MPYNIAIENVPSENLIELLKVAENLGVKHEVTHYAEPKKPKPERSLEAKRPRKSRKTRSRKSKKRLGKAILKVHVTYSQVNSKTREGVKRNMLLKLASGTEFNKGFYLICADDVLALANHYGSTGGNTSANKLIEERYLSHPSEEDLNVLPRLSFDELMELQ